MNRAQTRRGWQAQFRGERPRLRDAKASTQMHRMEERGLPTRNVPKESPSAVRVHIEELVLRGLERADRDRIAAALRYELLGILTAKGLPPDWRHSRSFETGETAPARVTSRASADWIGTHIAQAIYRVREERRR